MRIEKLDQLIGKLNATSRSALDEAVKLCGLRGNLAVEIEHWLQAILAIPGTDFSRICNHFNIDLGRLNSQITSRLDRQKRGSSDAPRISERVLELAGQAWLIASIDQKTHRIATGHLLCSIFADPQFAPIAELTELSHIPQDSLFRNLAALVEDSFESDAEKVVAGHEAATDQPRIAASVEQTALGQFAIDLTEMARSGKIDPVMGRDPEIRQIMDILLRRRQNNPILTGEAGVGKTAVVEGFALRITQGDVPEKLRNVRLLTLDLGALQAGAGVKGEFERRLKSVIDEVKSSPEPIILFIDEAHNLVGAGGQAGQGDAANLLKPALARGELRTIAATTWAEYKHYFEKDAALTRRFQVIKVEEPSHPTAVEMMQGLIPTLEHHHRVLISQEAIQAAVDLSGRYIAGRQLPDKSVSVLDTTCARVALSQSATPAPVEDAARKIRSLELSLQILMREAQTGKADPEKLKQVETQLKKAREHAQTLEKKWAEEKKVAEIIWDLTSRLTGQKLTEQPREKTLSENGATSNSSDDPQKSGGAPSAATPETATASTMSSEDRDQALQDLEKAEKQLKLLQGEQPLIHISVTAESVAETIEGWTGIPLGRMVADEIQTVLNLKSKMEESIIGQGHAIDAISERIVTARAGLRDPRTPIGVFMLTGTSGVGKTETAIALAELLYGGEQNMTIINMTEFKEEHKVSQLMGPPPGYKGYEEGGVLTEAVRRKPYSVILLDEIEKAHPGVQEIFYQVFDKGMLRDGQGRDVDFKNTLIIITTNACSDFIASLCVDPDTTPLPDQFIAQVRPKLLEVFKPAFLNRTTLVPYYPLRDEVLQKITRLKLSKVERRVAQEYKALCIFSDAVARQISDRCKDVDAGARNIDHIVNHTLLPQMSARLLSHIAAEQIVKKIEVDMNPEGRFEITIN